MKIVVSHPTGNANVRNALNGLFKSDLLHSFHTSIATFPNNPWGYLSRYKAFDELKRRNFDVALRNKTKQYPAIEMGRILSTKLKIDSLIAHEKGMFSIDSVYGYIDKKVSNFLDKNKTMTAIYAYEDEALKSFQKAKECGITCLYDLPIGYWRAAQKYLYEEKEKRPEWAMTLTGFNDSKEKLDKKDKELALADKIIVASSFTAKTLNQYCGTLSPISVIPYGFPEPNYKREYKTNNNRPLQLLFVGGLSQRKGIANVFEAVTHFGNAVELTVVGHKSSNDCKPLNNFLSKCNWIPSLPHDKILMLMQNADVLLFPSLFEGFGLVITEAMSQGTPVITTDRTIGPDIIRHNENGWIIDAGSTEAIVEAIENILAERRQLIDVGKSAMETARLRPWSRYGEELAIALQKKQINQN